MSDELERRLKDFPSEFPRPDEEVTRRVASKLRVRRRRAIPRAATLLAALVAGAAIGSVSTSASNSTVTIGVRPALLRYGEKPEIFGAVTNAKAGETVTVQFKQCGLYPLQFRDFMTTQTIEGGAWSLQELPGVRLQIPASGLFRAAWGNETSREVEVKMRVGIGLRRLPRGRGFYVGVAGAQSFWHRRVRVERFDTRSRRWSLVRSLLLTDSGGFRGSGEATVLSNTEPFRLGVPKGTMLRAVLPLAAARPCYLAGYSKLQRA